MAGRIHIFFQLFELSTLGKLCKQIFIRTEQFSASITTMSIPFTNAIYSKDTTEIRKQTRWISLVVLNDSLWSGSVETVIHVQYAVQCIKINLHSLRSQAVGGEIQIIKTEGSIHLTATWSRLTLVTDELRS